MSMLTRRLQVLIDEARYRRLSAAALERRSSVGALVRDAIDRAYPTSSSAKREAGRAVLAAERIPVPEPADLRRELEEIRGGSA